jgi:type IV secretory pathway VirB2 component (pilin)
MRASMLLAHINLYLAQVQPPDPAPKAPPGKVGDATNFVLGIMKWGGLAAAVGAFIAAGIMMIVGRRNRNSLAVDGAMSMPWIVGGLALVLGAASIVSLLI